MKKASRCRWAGDGQQREAHHLLMSLAAVGDGYMRAVCEVVVYAQDGSSRKRREMVARALEAQKVIAALLALLDPVHYETEEKL